MSKKIVISDKAFELLDRIQFAMNLYNRHLSKSEALIVFCNEVNRVMPRDSFLRTDTICYLMKG